MHYWPFWLGGLALAGVAVGYWLAAGRLLGVSGSFARVLDGPDEPAPSLSSQQALDELLAATRAEFGDAALDLEGADAPADPPAPPVPASMPWAGHLALLLALIAGGAIGALTRGAFHVRLDPGPDFTHLLGSGWRTWLALAGGGVLVGFGTQMAGGCTSGHGLCGTSRLQSGSLLATAAFFGAAVGVSLLLQVLS
jgi:uncharacterized membrane protein YedE/YeeE